MVKKPIRLEKYVSAKDSSGDFKETVTKYNLWAEVQFNSGQRSSLNGQTKIKNSYTFKIYWKGFDITGNWRVVYDGKRLTVLSIEKVNRFFFKLTTEG